MRGICLFLSLMLSVSAAKATSCGRAIDKVQAQVDARIETIARTDPGARETRAARLHHQPTPASIAAAERGLKGDARVERAIAALKQARRAEARGDRTACQRALIEARAAMSAR